RGASRVHYCERDPRNISLIRKNAEKLGVSANIELTRGSAPQVFDRISKQFDLIFMDPPFPDDNMEALLKSVFDRKLLSKNGLITIQRFRGSKDIEAGPFELLRKHRVGDSMLWFFEYPLALKEERSVTT
ncbi:MAG: RsmD family RNA methyltransferase, partial [Bdellovibrionales bacterium]|nr:RsmD family RNA methyltransferase [Bdellovibrionales bacterium]